MKKIRLIKSFNLWFTGLPSSGKTTTAIAFRKFLDENSIPSVHLDGDVVRTGLSADLKFSDADREENIRRIVYVTQIVVDSGIPVLTTFISPFKKNRELARSVINSFIEVFINTPLEKCIERDVKGLYAKAKAGEIKDMTGLNSPYELPENPELTIDTLEHNLDENVRQIKEYLLKNGYIEEIEG